MVDAAHRLGPRESTPPDDPVLAEIVRRLVAAYAPEQIYLFGSHARGEAGPDSDYDIMVVVSDEAAPRYRRGPQPHQILWEIGTAADVLVVRRSYFDSRASLKASLPGTVLREGRLLYAA